MIQTNFRSQQLGKAPCTDRSYREPFHQFRNCFTQTFLIPILISIRSEQFTFLKAHLKMHVD